VARRVKLRVVAPEASTPTIDAVRASLGGRVEGPADSAVGSLCTVEGREATPVVVLFAEGDEAHVWVGEGLVRRVNRAWLRTFMGEVLPAIARIAEDIRALARLEDGERVSFLARGTEPPRVDSGWLVEKCRFGALVERDDGVVVGVGFRRLWRAPTAVH
jgi:hypothetical protein